MKKPVNRVSLIHNRLPVEAVPPYAGWIISCMSLNAAFLKPPIPYLPPVPPDPTLPFIYPVSEVTGNLLPMS